MATDLRKRLERVLRRLEHEGYDGQAQALREMLVSVAVVRDLLAQGPGDKMENVRHMLAALPFAPDNDDPWAKALLALLAAPPPLPALPPTPSPAPRAWKPARLHVRPRHRNRPRLALAPPS